MKSDESAQAMPQEKTFHAYGNILLDELNQIVEFVGIHLKGRNMPSGTVTPAMAPVVQGPYGDTLRSQPFNDIPIPAGMFSQTMGDDKTGFFMNGPVISVEDLQSFTAGKSSGGFSIINH
jgi:hypothetical protein